jgi:hypothetical protein
MCGTLSPQDPEASKVVGGPARSRHLMSQSLQVSRLFAQPMLRRRSNAVVQLHRSLPTA